MNRSSFVIRHEAGRLFKKCLANRPAPRRLLKAFTLCTLPAISLGQAWAQAQSAGPYADADVGVADLTPIEDDFGAAIVPPPVDATAGAAGWGFAGTTPVYSGDSDEGFAEAVTTPLPTASPNPTGPIQQAQGELIPPPVSTPVITDDPLIGQTVSSDELIYNNDLSQLSLVQYRLTRDNVDIAGVPNAWTGFSTFMPLRPGADGNDLWFFNPRFLIDDTGRFGANLGLGKRWYNPVVDRAYEFSTWFDVDDGFAKTYHQVGVATAMIAGNWEYRLGANWVTSEDYNLVGAATFGSVATVQGSQVVIPTNQVVEQAFDRYEFEVAMPMGFLGPWGGTAGFGGYGLVGSDRVHGAMGASGRFEMQFNENFWANVTVTHDSVFDTNVSFNFEYTLPDGRANEWLRKPLTSDYLTASTRRRYRPTVQRTTLTDITPILDKNGAAYDVAFIDPNRGLASGTGTLEDPFVSILDYTNNAAAGAYDIIVVRPQFDATGPQDANLNTTITLADNQILTGDALGLTLPGSAAGVAGQFTLQNFRYSDPFRTYTPADPITLPTISNSNPLSVGNAVVTLGNNNIVQGLRIDATDTANGIESRAGGITGFTIQNNEIVRFIDATSIQHIGTGYGVFQENFVHGRTSAVGDSSFAQLGLGLADLGLTQAEVEAALGATFADEAATLAAMQLDAIRLTTVGTSNSLGDGFGRVRGLEVIHNDAAGTLSLYVANNSFEGIGGEDANQNGVRDVPPVVPRDEDVNGNGQLDVGRAVYVEIVQGTLNADDPDTAITLDDQFCVITFPTGIVGNTVGEFLGTTPQAGSGAVYGIDVVGRAGTTIDLVERNNTVGGGVGAAGRIDPSFRILSDGSDINVDEFSGNLSDGSFQDGGQFVAVAGGTIDFINPLFSPSSPLLNPAEAPAFRNNTFTNSGANGIIVQALGGEISFDAFGTQLVGGSNVANTFTDNTEAGVVFDAADVAGNSGRITVGNAVTGVRQAIAGNTISGNGLEGMRVTTTNGGQIDVDFGQVAADDTLTLGQSFVNNGADGLSIRNGANDIFVVVPNGDLTTPLAFLPPPAAPNTLDGTVPGVPLTTSLVGVTATGNGENGVEFIVDDGATITASRLDRLALNNNTGAGLEIRAEEASTFTAGDGIRNSTFNDNTRASVLLSGDGSTGADSTVTLGEVIGNQFNRTGTGGYGIEFDATDVTYTGQFKQNTFIGGGADSGPGVGGTVTGGGVTLTFGADNAADTNTFTGNGDAHIGFVLAGDSVNNIVVDNHILRGAVDRPTATSTLPLSFDGDGIAFDLRDTAILDGGIFRSKIVDNDGDGIDITVGGLGTVVIGGVPTDQFAQLRNFEITDNEIIGNGDGTSATLELGDNGIELTRTANGVLGSNTNPLPISGNNVIGSANNGLLVNSAGTPLTDFIDASNNMFNYNGYAIDVIDIPSPNGTDNDGDGNPDLVPIAVVAGTQTPIQDADLSSIAVSAGGGNGASITSTGDASVDIDFSNNEFIGNANSGILTSSVALSVTDTEFVTGTWTGNTVSLNREDGIEITGTTGNGPGDALQIGLPGATFPDNTITMNQSDGIEITGVGNVVIASNQISQNGLGFVGNGLEAGLLDFDEAARDSQMAGIDIDTNVIAATITQNIITDNRGDGVEYRNGGTAIATVSITGNTITENDGRGVDLLAVGASSASSTFGFNVSNNDINNNLLQGVYVVTTADVTQQQNVAAADILQRTGSVFNDYRVALTVDNNNLIANGSTNVDGSGGADPSNTGVEGNADNTTGFVLRVGSSDGSTSIVDDGGFATTRGGVIAQVTNNAFAGSFGNDLLIEGFTSTADPGTGATWNDTTFNAGGYQTDPLARLDLTFGTTAIGNANTFTAGLFNEFGAVYDGADTQFKNRVNTPGNAVIEGPFSPAQGARQRNAQRQAVRTYPDGTPQITNGPGGAQFFFFPGLGDSTFRINNTGFAAADYAELIGLGFFFDAGIPGVDPLPIVDNPADPNGRVRPGFGAGSALPYGWGTTNDSP